MKFKLAMVDPKFGTCVVGTVDVSDNLFDDVSGGALAIRKMVETSASALEIHSMTQVMEVERGFY